ncbi:SDR family NAD(P)-dependent oxidoreductase [Deinococcus altitudinis]|uniref:SDR family NAD(P)-dependent oxidoreductase n=1 Tax=Deinococcus altitudinis TaxID=468914 RepID=UPI003891BF7D
MTNIAIITGGSRGLGKNMVQHVAKGGTDVIFTYQSRDAEAQALVAELQASGRRAAALPLDVSRADTSDHFVAQVQGVLTGWGAEHFQFLVNNAGIGIHASFEQTTPEQMDLLYAIHVKGPFFLTQKLLPLMSDGGRILNVSTGLTRFALPGYAAYASMKGAVETLTMYLALELGARRISVNVLAPGAIETDFGGGMVRDNGQVNAAIASHTALGRVGLPDDIGGVVAALLSPGTGWIHAQRIEASGGQNL